MPSRKHFSTSIKPSRTFHVECDVSSINRKRVPYHMRLKSNFDRLLYIIFFITQIHTVCSINREASRVRPSKKKILRKKFKKKKNFGKKIVKQKFWKINFKNKILEKNLKKKLQNKNIHNQNL